MTGMQKTRILRNRIRKFVDDLAFGYEMDMAMGYGECSDLIGGYHERITHEYVRNLLEKIGITPIQYLWYLNQIIPIESKYLDRENKPWEDCPISYYDYLTAGSCLDPD